MSRPARFHAFGPDGPQYEPIAIHDGMPDAPIVLRDMVCFPEFDSLYHADGSRAPETSVRRGGAWEMHSIGPDRVEVPANIARYERPLIYLGTLTWNVWGHYLLEGLSRVWALKHRPELSEFGGFYFTRPGQLPWWPHVMALLSNSDIEFDRLVHCTSPLMLSEVHVPAPTFVIRNHAYTVHREQHAAVARRILGGEAPSRSDEPVFLSRQAQPDSARQVIGEDRLQSIVADAGLRIVNPELMSFEDQVKLYNSHSVFVGCIGSAFHSLLFSPPNTGIRTVILCDPNFNSNYRIVDALQALDADYVRCLTLDPASRKIDPDRFLDLDVALHHLKDLGIL